MKPIHQTTVGLAAAQPPKPGMRVVHTQIDAQSLRVQQALLRLLTPAWAEMRDKQAGAALAARAEACAAAAAPPNPGPAA